MYHEHNFQLRTLLECVDLDDSQCFDLITDSIANDAQFEDEYQAHIDEMISQLSTYDNPVPNFATDDQLNELETEYIENDFNQSTANEFTVQCDVSVRSMLPRYRCIGSLFQNESEDATTENSWHFFNRKLDLVIGDIYSSSNERYSEGMVCWFDRILIEQTIRNRYNHSTSFHCEIPLRVAQYSSDGILTQLEQDVARTRANDSIECSPPSPQNSVVYRCKIKVFSAWFESGTENDVLLSSLHMYSREISNQIHSSNPHVYAQSSCLVSSESLEYHEIDAEGLRYASAFMNCQYMM